MAVGTRKAVKIKKLKHDKQEWERYKSLLEGYHREKENNEVAS